MRAGLDFVERLADAGMRPLVTRFVCRLHGSLAATGVGHGTPDAVIAGLRGHRPETVDPAVVHGEWARLHAGSTVSIGVGPAAVPMVAADIEFAPRECEHGHPNALTLTAFGGEPVLAAETYLSVGGGFIERVGDDDARGRRFDRQVRRFGTEVAGDLASREPSLPSPRRQAAVTSGSAGTRTRCVRSCRSHPAPHAGSACRSVGTAARRVRTPTSADRVGYHR